MFLVNDIVHLKSGSPDLRIIAVDGNQVKVTWRTDDGRVPELMLPAVCFHKL